MDKRAPAFNIEAVTEPGRRRRARFGVGSELENLPATPQRVNQVTELDMHRVQSWIDELDSIIDRDKALVSIERVHKPMGYFVVANQAGLLGLANELLRASQGKPVLQTEDFDGDAINRTAYLNSGPYTSLVQVVRDDKIEREEPLPVKSHDAGPSNWSETLFFWAFPCAFLTMLILSCVGLIDVVSTIVSWFR